MITLIGERLILSLINDKGKSAKYFAVGNNAQPPKKTIQGLGQEILRAEPVKQFNFVENSIEFLMETTSEQIEGANEIGLFTKDNELLCYETFDSFNFPDFTEITLKISISLEAEELQDNWHPVKNKLNIHAKKTDIYVKGVYDDTHKTGYRKSNNLWDIETNECSYFYNQKERILYVHCENGENPNDLELLIRG